MKINQDYYSILEALGDGVIAIDSNNKLNYINKKAIAIIGRKPSIDDKICEIFKVKTEKKGEIINQILAEVKQTGITRGLEKGAYIDVA